MVPWGLIDDEGHVKPDELDALFLDAGLYDIQGTHVYRRIYD